MTAVLSAELSARFHADGRPRVHAAGPLELRGPLGASSFYYVRNVTAGVFAGDSYRYALHCEPGAHATIESSSATRVYSMPAGSAEANVDLVAEAGGRLVWGPHATILHTGSALTQSTRITVHPGALVLAAEILVLGRLATGERYDFRSYTACLDVFTTECAPAYREAFSLAPGPELEGAMGGQGVLTCVYALGAVPPDAGDRLEAIAAPQELTGWSALPNGCGVVVKALAPSLSAGTAIARACLDVLGNAEHG